MNSGPSNRKKADAPSVIMSVFYRRQEGRRKWAELMVSTFCQISVIWPPLVSMENFHLLTPVIESEGQEDRRGFKMEVGVIN